jgi:hypothetical protein
MNGMLLLFDGSQIESSLQRLVDRKVREQRRNERRLAEQRTTKHQFQAIKSCIADARSYRIAKGLPVLAVAKFHGGLLNPGAKTSETDHTRHFAANLTSRTSHFVATLARRLGIFRSA